MRVAVIKKIFGWLDIDEFRRDRPPPKRLAAADLFDEYAQNDYADCDYTDLSSRGVMPSIIRFMPKTGLYTYRFK